jgi:hypothetical protein
MSNLITHPEYERLFNEIRELKEKISALYLERDNLLYHQCPHIKAEYMIKIGAAEYKVFEMECYILRLKRKIELIQQKINNQEMVVLSFIDLQLDEEYKKWDEKLSEKMNEMNESLKLHSTTSAMSDEESAEMKQLYATLVKKLHPDLNPTSTPAGLKFFRNTVDAYKAGDLPALRTIKLLTDGFAEAVAEYSSIEIMEQTRDIYKAEVINIENNISKVKSSFPYSVKTLIYDDNKVKDRQNELNSELKKNEAIYKSLEERLAVILEDNHG